MTDQNFENQSNEPKRNPTRDNQKINQGGYKGKFGEEKEEQRLGQDEPNQKPEVEFGGDRKEVDLDRSGVGTSDKKDSASFRPEKGQEKQEIKDPRIDEKNQKNFTNQADGSRGGQQEQGRVDNAGKANPSRDEGLRH